jgi:hypothetical protein
MGNWMNSFVVMLMIFFMLEMNNLSTNAHFMSVVCTIQLWLEQIDRNILIFMFYNQKCRFLFIYICIPVYRLYIKEELINLGCKQANLDPALFYLHTDGKLNGSICCHVDDLHQIFLFKSWKANKHWNRHYVMTKVHNGLLQTEVETLFIWF